MGKRRKQLVAVALADAAAYGDVALVEGRAVAQGDVLHGGDLPVEPRVGSLADAARHEHDDVRLLDGFDGQRAQALQHAGDPLGIVLVHLAAEGVDAETSSLEDVAHRGGAPRLDGEADGRAVLAVDDDVREGGDAADLDAHRREEPAGDGHGFHSLVHRTGPHGLNLHRRPVFDHAGDGAGNGGGRRLGGYFEAPDGGLGFGGRHS